MPVQMLMTCCIVADTVEEDAEATIVNAGMRAIPGIDHCLPLMPLLQLADGRWVLISRFVGTREGELNELHITTFTILPPGGGAPGRHAFLATAMVRDWFATLAARYPSRLQPSASGRANRNLSRARQIWTQCQRRLDVLSVVDAASMTARAPTEDDGVMKRDASQPTSMRSGTEASDSLAMVPSVPVVLGSPVASSIDALDSVLAALDNCPGSRWVAVTLPRAAFRLLHSAGAEGLRSIHMESLTRGADSESLDVAWSHWWSPHHIAPRPLIAATISPTAPIHPATLRSLSSAEASSGVTQQQQHQQHQHPPPRGAGSGAAVHVVQARHRSHAPLTSQGSSSEATARSRASPRLIPVPAGTDTPASSHQVAVPLEGAMPLRPSGVAGSRSVAAARARRLRGAGDVDASPLAREHRKSQQPPIEAVGGIVRGRFPAAQPNLDGVEDPESAARLASEHAMRAKELRVASSRVPSPATSDPILVASQPPSLSDASAPLQSALSHTGPAHRAATGRSRSVMPAARRPAATPEKAEDDERRPAAAVTPATSSRGTAAIALVRPRPPEPRNLAAMAVTPEGATTSGGGRSGGIIGWVRRAWRSLTAGRARPVVEQHIQPRAAPGPVPVPELARKGSGSSQPLPFLSKGAGVGGPRAASPSIAARQVLERPTSQSHGGFEAGISLPLPEAVAASAIAAVRRDAMHKVHDVDEVDATAGPASQQPVQPVLPVAQGWQPVQLRNLRAALGDMAPPPTPHKVLDLHQRAVSEPTDRSDGERTSSASGIAPGKERDSARGTPASGSPVTSDPGGVTRVPESSFPVEVGIAGAAPADSGEVGDAYSSSVAPPTAQALSTLGRVLVRMFWSDRDDEPDCAHRVVGCVCVARPLHLAELAGSLAPEDELMRAVLRQALDNRSSRLRIVGLDDVEELDREHDSDSASEPFVVIVLEAAV